MRSLFRKPFWVAFAMGTAVGLNACSLSSTKSDGTASLYVDLSSLKGAANRFALMNSGGGLYGLVPPNNAAAFSCYAVNVTGPGIGDSSPSQHPQDVGLVFSNLLNASVSNNYCSYRGVVTPPIILNAAGPSDATLQIPPGDIRLVQLVGINDPLVCASGVVDDPPGSTGGGGRFFEIGRSVVGGLFSDTSVDVAMSWPATAALQSLRTMDCGGACALDDHFQTGTASQQPMSASSPLIAQRIANVPGKYIRSIDLNIRSASAADTVTATIYQTTSGAVNPSGGATSFAASVAIPVTAGAVPYTFDLHYMGGYLQMQAGYDYWIVTSSAAANGTTSWDYTFHSATTSPDVLSYSASTWTSVNGTNGMNYRVNECAP